MQVEWRDSKTGDEPQPDQKVVVEYRSLAPIATFDSDARIWHPVNPTDKTVPKEIPEADAGRWAELPGQQEQQPEPDTAPRD